MGKIVMYSRVMHFFLGRILNYLYLPYLVHFFTSPFSFYCCYYCLICDNIMR